MMSENTTSLKTFQDVYKKPLQYITRDMRGSKLKEYIKGYKLSSLQKEVLIGSLLGDGTLTGNKTSMHTNLNYKVEQSMEKQEYVDFHYKVFQDIVGTHPKIRYQGKQEKSYWFRSYRHICLKFYADQFYEIDALGNRRKKVPKLIHRWLTPLALAIWFQDDGSKKPNGYELHTEGFYRYEIQVLQRALTSNYKIQVNIQKEIKKATGKTYYKLYIPETSKDIFTEIVRPYIFDCFQYKLHK
jgi:hypothetical protein